MIPEKIKSIINSCNTHAQLDTCTQWVDYMYSNYESKWVEAYKHIKKRKAQIEICGAKVELINKTQIA
jgi:hypothetical protein